jgi:hypothetical protein
VAILVVKMKMDDETHTKTPIEANWVLERIQEKDVVQIRSIRPCE